MSEKTGIPLNFNDTAVVFPDGETLESVKSNPVRMADYVLPDAMPLSERAGGASEKRCFMSGGGSRYNGILVFNPAICVIWR